MRRQSPAGHFRPDIEGLRAVAVLVVLAFHAGLPFVPGGYVGVDVFFVISGFLITGLLVREVERSGRVSLLGFYARRAKRLLPAASLVLVATALLTWLFVPRIRWTEIGGDLAASALYLINWRLADRAVDYLAEDSVASPVQHYWSLAVEEQFYLLWPLLIILGAWLVRRHRLRVRPVLGLLLGLVVVSSFTWSVLLTATDPDRAYFVTTTRLWELGVGGLVALGAPLWARLRVPHATALAWGGLLALGLSVVVLDSGTSWPGSAALLPTLGTAAVIAGGLRSHDRGPVRLLGTAPMRRVGAWSYSLYLWHWPLLVIAAARWGELSTLQGCAVVAFAFLPSWLTYVVLEDPVRRSAVLTRLPAAALALGLGVTVVGAGAGLLLVQDVRSQVQQAEGTGAQGAAALDSRDDAASTSAGSGEAGPEPATAGPDTSGLDLTPEVITPDPLVATEDVPALYDQGCSVAPDEVEVVMCRGGDPEGELTVALVGDSKIAQWGDALDVIAREEGWALRTYIKSGCTWTAATVDNDGPDTGCRTWGQDVRERLTGAERPDVVLVSGVKTGAVVESGDDAAAEQALVEGYVEQWSALGAVDVPVVVLTDSPQTGGLSVYECVDENRQDVTVCSFDRNAGSGTSALRAAAERVPGTAVVDMNDWVCPVDPCPPVIGDVLVYRQGSHITTTYAVTLVEPLRARLLAALAPAR